MRRSCKKKNCERSEQKFFWGYQAPKRELRSSGWQSSGALVVWAPELCMRELRNSRNTTVSRGLCRLLPLLLNSSKVKAIIMLIMLRQLNLKFIAYIFLVVSIFYFQFDFIWCSVCFIFCHFLVVFFMINHISSLWYETYHHKIMSKAYSMEAKLPITFLLLRLLM